MNPVPPPPNRAMGCYRFVLWIMPTCIALTTIAGFSWLSSFISVHEELTIVVWFILNILATLGIGLFEVKLRNSYSSFAIETCLGVARFIMLQFLIVPALLLALLFSAWLFGYF